MPPEQLPRFSTCAEDVEAQASLAALLGPPFAVVFVVNYFCRPLLPQILELVAPKGILIFEAWAEGNQQFAKPKSAQVGDAENSGYLILGPYNKDPILLFRVLYKGLLCSETPR